MAFREIGRFDLRLVEQFNTYFDVIIEEYTQPDYDREDDECEPSLVFEKKYTQSKRAWDLLEKKTKELEELTGEKCKYIA